MSNASSPKGTHLSVSPGTGTTCPCYPSLRLPSDPVANTRAPSVLQRSLPDMRGTTLVWRQMLWRPTGMRRSCVSTVNTILLGVTTAERCISKVYCGVL